MASYKCIQVGHYLASFVGSTSDASALELTAAREEIDLLKYLLEQERSANTKLVKEANSSEEALREAREMIDHRDNELRRAEKRIKNLERQRSKTEKKIKDLKK